MILALLAIILIPFGAAYIASLLWSLPVIIGTYFSTAIIVVFVVSEWRAGMLTTYRQVAGVVQYSLSATALWWLAMLLLIGIPITLALYQ